MVLSFFGAKKRRGIYNLCWGTLAKFMKNFQLTKVLGSIYWNTYTPVSPRWGANQQVALVIRNTGQACKFFQTRAKSLAITGYFPIIKGLAEDLENMQQNYIFPLHTQLDCV